MDNQTPNTQKKKTTNRKKNDLKQKFANSRFVKKYQELAQKFTSSRFGGACSRHFDKHGYLYCSFLIPSMLFFFVFIMQGTYPFGNGSVLVLDLNGQYVYFFEMLRKAIYGDASLLFTWFGTLGGEGIGIYAYYLASPLSYIVALFPETAMTEALLVLELLKCGLCGLTMAYYLRKTRPRAHEMITIMIAVMYALSAYAIVMAHNTMWIDALIWLPLITYGIERLINYGHFKLFVISLTLAVFSNFYIGYMLCIFVFVYFFYYYFFASNRKSSLYATTVVDGNNNFILEKHHFLKSLLRIGAASVIALLIACAILLPTYYSLTLGKTTFSTTDWSFAFKFNPLDFISKLFIASYDSVRRSGFPFLYCGMFALLLVPVYFVSKRVTPRQKIGAGLLLLFFFLSMIISPLDLIWHGFQEPNWLNYRYSFMFSFVMLLLAHRALELLHTVMLKKTIIIASVWAGLVVICSFFTQDMFDKSYARREAFFILIPLVCLAIYVIAHHLLLNERKHPAVRSSMMVTLAIIVCLEMFVGTLLNTTSLNEDVTFSPKYTRADGTWLEGYDNFLDKYRPIVNAIQASDSSFYRMEKDVLRKYDDNFALAMRGTTGSTSTLNAKTIAFLNRLGYLSQSNISQYKGGTPVGDSLLGIKYLVLSSTQEPADYYLSPHEVLIKGQDAASYEYEYADGKYLYSYLNDYALSMAFASSDALKEYNITEYTSPFATMNALLSSLLGEETEVFKELPYSFTFDDTVTFYGEIDSNGDRKPGLQYYGETLYDKNGEPLPSLDANGNIRYGSNGQVEYQKENTAYHTFVNTSTDGSKVVVTFTFTTPSDIDYNTEIFFKLPTKYSRQCTWTFTAEDVTEEKSGSCYVDDDKTNCILPLGTIGPDRQGTLVLTLVGDEDPNTQDKLYIDASDGNGIFYYVDETAYVDVMDRLAEGNLAITAYTESSFHGTVNAEEDKTTMFTSIPYEKYWDVYVDGKQVETYMTCAALLAFDLPSAGEHTVDIVYHSDALYTGINLSVAGITLFVLWVVLDSLIFRKKRMANAVLDYDCLSVGDYESDDYDEELKEKAQKAERARERMRRHNKKK